jgi:glycerophosphoryl diester phosphodiesterase
MVLESVLISAHRGGAGFDTARENTVEALEAAVVSDCDYVEFDVQRCKDGVYVLHHDDFVMVNGAAMALADLSFEQFRQLAGNFVLLDDCLNILKGHKKAHVDFKFVSPSALYDDPLLTWEVAATRHIIEQLGKNAIITTMEDASVQAVRAWSRVNEPELLVGLSLGRDFKNQSLWVAVLGRLSEIFPTRRMIACDANLMVANKRLARLSLARWAKKHRVPLLAWTVNSSRELKYWLKPGRAWLVTSNHPTEALSIRSKLI